MDFMNRGLRQSTPASTGPKTDDGMSVNSGTTSSGKRGGGEFKWLKFVNVSLLFSITILLVGLVLSVGLAKKNDVTEKNFVDHSKMQAVFIDGGQVYFGKIGTLNTQYLTVTDIYYLRVNQQVQPNQQGQQQQTDISLVKLGCELHGPQDVMVLNRDKVTFWENLKDDGQVAKAVAEYKKQNPGEQKCATPEDSTTNTTPSTKPTP